MPLKPLGRPAYLLPTEIEQDDVVEIIEKPWIVEAEHTKFGKPRGKTVIKILRTDAVRTWTMNTTTWDKLIQAFGEDPDQWLNKTVQIKKEVRNVSGVDKEVLFGRPYKEPQQQLPKADLFNPNLYGAKPLPIDVATLTLEQKQALRKALAT